MSTNHLDLHDAAWRTSTYSNGQGGDCVEVADGFAGAVPVRDSKTPDTGVLVLATAAWGAFLDTVR